MIRTTALLPLAALAACSGAESAESDSVSCIAEIEQLLADRTAYVQQALAELDGSEAGNSESSVITEEDLRSKEWAAAQEVTDQKALAAAIGQFRARAEQYSIEDMQPLAEFMAEIEAYENRIQIALADCPEARTMLDTATRTVPIQVQKP